MKNKLLRFFLIIVFFIFFIHLLKDITQDILKIKTPLDYIGDLKEVVSSFSPFTKVIYYFFGVLSIIGEIFLTISIPLFLFKKNKKSKKLLKLILIVFVFLVIYFITVYSFLFLNPNNFYVSFPNRKIINYEIDNKDYKLLIADDPLEWQKGLMYQIDKKQFNGADGMIFIFPNHEVRSFWNKNTYLDLDVYWIDNNKVIGKEYLPNILTTKEPYIISSNNKVNKVVEIIR